MSINGELQAFAQDAKIELFVLEGGSLGTDVFRFHAGVNEYFTNIIWQGNEYTAIPMQADGFEFNGKTFPRPKIQIANTLGAFSSLVAQYDDLIGCKVTRKQTLAKFLDVVNFKDGNPYADPAQALPDELFYVTQKTVENKTYIEFELGTALDISGVALPRRQVIASVCPFRYRGEECGYAGGSVAKFDDTPTTVLSEDNCSKKVSGCKLRFGANGELSFGGFPMSASLDV